MEFLKLLLFVNMLAEISACWWKKEEEKKVVQRRPKVGDFREIFREWFLKNIIGKCLENVLENFPKKNENFTKLFREILMEPKIWIKCGVIP